MQANVLGCVCGVRHFGGIFVGPASMDPVLLRPQARFPRMVLPAADSGRHKSCTILADVVKKGQALWFVCTLPNATKMCVCIRSI